MDVSVTFEGLSQNPFELDESTVATCVMVPEKHQFLNRFMDKEGRFDYSLFLNYFCEELWTCLRSIDKVFIPRRLAFNTEWQPCANCHLPDSERMMPMTHCLSCVPAVTYSKLGPCLLFTWKTIWGSQTVLSLDLIPNFYVKYAGNTGTLFQKVFQSLKLAEPDGWRQHCHQVSLRDRHVTDTRIKEGAMLDGFDPVTIAGGKMTTEVMPFKLLNYSQHRPNYVIRPKHQIKDSNLDQSEMLRTFYILVKAMKKVLGLEISNYFIKKCHLSCKNRCMLFTMADPEEGYLRDFVFMFRQAPFVLRIIDVHGDFRDSIDMKTWMQNCLSPDAVLSRYIPLSATDSQDQESSKDLQQRCLEDFYYTCCLQVDVGLIVERDSISGESV